MIADLKPYPEYKESGLPWLGRVPGHWNVRRLRASITDCINGVWGTDPNGKEDLLCVRVADFDRVKLRVSLRKKTVRAIQLSARSRRLLQWGDLLLEKSGGGDLQPVGAVVAYDHDEPAVCSNFVARMPIASGYDNFFVNYLHFTLYANRVNIRSIKQTTGIQNLDGKAYLSEPVAFPPPDEQTAIVRFLDWANGRLERAIRAKRKVIALLNEQKQAIIHRAVTRGLDPSVPLKPSGIPWLGDIPQHWEVRQLGRFITLQRGFDITKTQQEPGLIPVVSSGGVSSFHNKFTSPGPGVILGRKGSVGALHFIDGPYWAHDTTLWVKDFGGNHPRLVYYLLSLLHLKRFDTGSSNPTLNRNLVHPEMVCFPPFEEQESIVVFLDDVISKTERSILRLEREIELLREYRTRLVADVVTGKLDVREAAARLPEERDKSDLSGLSDLDDNADEPEPEEEQ
jgi:type I restriction enzyme, S subunit